MFGRLERIAAAFGAAEFDEVFRREFNQIQGISIDYAVLEHARAIAVCEAPFAWDDLGSWRAIARLRGTDEAGNTIVGKHLGFETTGTIVRGGADHLIVTLGLANCIVVHTPQATLVADQSREEEIRRVVKELQDRGWEEYL
jgi:mannose-1-phosphate guanylyltransferase